MSVPLLTEHYLSFLSLKEGCPGLSESTLVKMPHCWKSHVAAHMDCQNHKQLKENQIIKEREIEKEEKRKRSMCNWYRAVSKMVKNLVSSTLLWTFWTLCMLGNLQKKKTYFRLLIFLSFFSKSTCSKEYYTIIVSTVSNKIRPDKMIQTVCQTHQQNTPAEKELKLEKTQVDKELKPDFC